jgi:hypothetical protein
MKKEKTSHVMEPKVKRYVVKQHLLQQSEICNLTIKILSVLTLKVYTGYPIEIITKDTKWGCWN